MARCDDTIALTDASGQVLPAALPVHTAAYLNTPPGRVSVLDISATDLAHLSSVTFQHAPTSSSPLVVNVDTTAVGDDFAWTPPSFVGVADAAARYILFNFPTAKRVTVDGSPALTGTLYAPMASLSEHDGAQIDGSVIAAAFTQGAPGDRGPESRILNYPFAATVHACALSRATPPADAAGPGAGTPTPSAGTTPGTAPAAGLAAPAAVRQRHGSIQPRVVGGVVNGGFETGALTGWTTTAGSAQLGIGNAHSGTYSASLGPDLLGGVSSLSQTFTAPTDTYSLSLWYNQTVCGNLAADTATATLRNNTTSTTITPFTQICPASPAGWLQIVTPVIAGDSYTLTLTSTNAALNFGDHTTTLFDDIETNGLAIAKTADVSTTTPGSTVHYTITVTNSGQTAYTGAAFSDSLAGVLDDAAYNNNAATTAGAVAYTSPNLTWSGNLAVGAAATITYSVTVSVPFTSTVINQGSTKLCMDDPGASTTAGTQLQLLTCNATGEENWTFTPVSGRPSAYTITTPAALCVDVSGTSHADNATVIQNTCNSQADQQFTLQPLTVSGAAKTYNLVALHSGKCIVPAGDGTASGTLLVQLPCSSAGTRVWQLPGAGDRALINTVTSSTTGTNCLSGSLDTRCAVNVPVLIPALTIVKSADVSTTTPGSTVHYTITVTNSGQTAYIGAAFSDSLAGVLDDAAYNNNAATTAGAVAYTSPNLTWSGNLAVGAAATITYSVTVNNPDTGDSALINTITSGTTPNNCVPGTTLGFLMSSSYGPATGTGQIHYTDGTTQSYTLTSPDWWNTTPPTGGAVAANALYQNQPGNTTLAHTADVFSVPIALTAGKTPAYLVLPAVGTLARFVPALHVFAIGGVSGSSLASTYNNVGITDDTNTNPGNFDGGANSFSKQALTTAGMASGSTITSSGLAFTLPSFGTGANDNTVANGQTITLAPADTRCTTAVTDTGPPVLSITVPSTTNLGSTTPGNTLSAALGTVTILDQRGLTNASWTATVSTTSFTTGGATGPETITRANVSYWSGPATSTTGTATVTPGQGNAAAAQTLSTTRTAFTSSTGNGSTIATWNPTLVVSVPAGAVAGTYTAVVTHSVA